MSEWQNKAAAFRALHDDGVLVLPNAWDAGSAVAIVRAGAAAVATSSAGVSWSLGRPDGHGVSGADMVEAVRRIAAAVEVPVTADVEGGYEDVAATVRGVVDAGAVGVNLEDSTSRTELRTAAAQADLIRVARAAGGAELWINARTDVYLSGIGEPGGRFDEVVSRGRVYADAGADSFFVPGLLDLEVLAALTAAVPLPVNVLAGPGAPGIAELGAVGVRRVSLGSAVSKAVFGLVQRAAREVLTEGTYGALAGGLDYDAVNGLFDRS